MSLETSLETPSLIQTKVGNRTSTFSTAVVRKYSNFAALQLIQWNAPLAVAQFWYLPSATLDSFSMMIPASGVVELYLWSNESSLIPSPSSQRII